MCMCVCQFLEAGHCLQPPSVIGCLAKQSHILLIMTSAESARYHECHISGEQPEPLKQSHPPPVLRNDIIAGGGENLGRGVGASSCVMFTDS